MPAPVRRSVFAGRVLWGVNAGREEGDREGRHGDKKSTRAAMAPLLVVPLAGMMRGAGKGSVYGIRRRGARGIAL